MGIDGTWVNDYGSVVELRQSGGSVTGLYQSHTGATGVYSVVGSAGRDEGDPRGSPISLAVSWHSLDGGEPDPSWAWCSAFSGQAITTGNDRSLMLQHCMIATTDLAGLCPSGLYLDKLCFRLAGDPAAGSPAELSFGRGSATTQGATTERWEDAAGTMLNLDFTQRGDAGFEEVRGFMTTSSSRLEIAGVRTMKAEGAAGTAQALAMTAFDHQAGRAIAWAALFDPRDGCMRLHELTSSSTWPAHIYTQTGFLSRDFHLSESDSDEV